MPYSRVYDIQVKVCEVKQQFLVWYSSPDKGDKDQIEGDAVMRISLIEGLAVMQYDVDLFGIPGNRHVQQEVTVNFYADIDNEGVFYTDSNALEMQKRVLNYRPTWNLTTKSGGLNITANMYPINSAISMID